MIQWWWWRWNRATNRPKKKLPPPQTFNLTSLLIYLCLYHFVMVRDYDDDDDRPLSTMIIFEAGRVFFPFFVSGKIINNQHTYTHLYRLLNECWRANGHLQQTNESQQKVNLSLAIFFQSGKNEEQERNTFMVMSCHGVD